MNETETITIEVPKGATVTVNGEVFKAKPEPLKLRPDHDSQYFRLSPLGEVCGEVCSDSYDGGIDAGVWNQGNGFFTEQEAELERDRRALEVGLLELIATLNHREGWVCDWGDSKQKKVNFNHSALAYGAYFYRSYEYQSRPTEHYFKPSLEAEIRAKFSDDDFRFIYTGERD